MHGRHLSMFRTFSTGVSSVNLVFHTLLMELEEIVRTEGRVPEVVRVLLKSMIDFVVAFKIKTIAVSGPHRSI